MLDHQIVFRWRADDGPLIVLSPINYKVALNQKRRRNASMRIDSLFVVTIRIDWYVSVYPMFPNAVIRFHASNSNRFCSHMFATVRKTLQRCVS